MLATMNRLDTRALSTLMNVRQFLFRDDTPASIGKYERISVEFH